MSDEGTKVSELGESGLLEIIAGKLGTPSRGEIWTGDDSALLTRGEHTLVTIDTLVEGLDFDLSYAEGGDVGWKAMAVNASDIAAMGGRPGAAVVSLTLPRSTEVAWVEDFLDGLLAAGTRWGIDTVGGDISEGPSVVVTVTLLGEPVKEAVLRSGASPGDGIYVTGSLGGAAGGLAVLRSGTRGSSEAHERLALRQLRPNARVDEAEALIAAGPTSMIDLSDGLAVDLQRVLDASGAGCEVDAALLPVDLDLGVVAASAEEALSLAITGGEDFELLFTVAPGEPEAAGAALAGTGTPVTRIGIVTDGARSIGDRDLADWGEEGWDHLR